VTFSPADVFVVSLKIEKKKVVYVWMKCAFGY